jgi:hypothetical protein
MSHNIDYSAKINSFKQLTNTTDDERALQYLMKYDWDVEVYLYKIFNYK